MLLKVEDVSVVDGGMDLFDSPFVHPLFVQESDGRICDGPVAQAVSGGYRFAFENISPLPSLGAKGATLWATGYGPTGGSFLDIEGQNSRNERDFCRGLDRVVEQSGADFLLWPYFPLQAKEYGWLSAWLDARKAKKKLIRRQHQRAFLDCRSFPSSLGRAPSADAGLTLSRNKRKTIGRQGRRLRDLGDVRFLSTKDGLDHSWALEVFLKVEASGWKARKGTALAVNPSLHAFVDGFLPALLAEGRARIDLMMLDHDCIAGLVSLQAGRGLFTWKTGMDEVYKRFSPGVHILLEISRQAMANPDIDYIDSLADAGHPVAEHLWAGRRNYAQLFLPLNAHGKMASLSLSAALESKQLARHWAKRMLGRI